MSMKSPMTLIRQAELSDVPAIVRIEELTALDCYPNAEHGITRDDIASIGFGPERIAKYERKYFDTSQLDSPKIPAPPDTPAPAISHFSVGGDAIASPSPDKMSSDSVLDVSGGSEVLRKSSEAAVWVAERSDRIVGFAIALRGTRLRLRKLYVLPEFWHQDIGPQLLEEALSWLGSAREVSLTVAAYDNMAIKFYETHGFRQVGPVPEDLTIVPSGKVVPETMMARPAATAS